MRNNDCGSTSAVKTNQYIKRQKVWIDTNIVSMKYTHGHNFAKYGVFKDSEAPNKIPIKRAISGQGVKHNSGNEEACFRVLLGWFKRDTKLNRMYYTMYLKELSPGTKQSDLRYNQTHIILEPGECKRWIELTKQYQLLPDYIDENCVEMFDKPKVVKDGMYDSHSAVGGGTIILDTSKLTNSLIYVYLSTFRNLREDPGFVRTALYLVDKLNMNFFAAYVFAGRIAISNEGHHIISTTRGYDSCADKTAEGARKQIEEINADVKWMVSLQRYIKDPSKYDTRSVCANNHSICANNRFSCNKTISRIYNSSFPITINEAFDPDVIKAIMSSSDKAAAEYIEKFKKKRPRIKYKEAVNAK